MSPADPPMLRRALADMKVAVRAFPHPRTWHPFRVWVGVCLVGYLVVVLAGLTTANVGAVTLRQDPAKPLGVQLGEPQAIRSDEYNTDSPLVLGALAAESDYTVSPLSESPDLITQIPDGPVSSLVFGETPVLNALPWVSDEMAFAARWWLPLVLLLIFGPLWFREVTGKYTFGFLFAAMVFFAPSNTWWSDRPTLIAGFVMLGCYAAFPLSRSIGGKRWLAAAGLLAVAALCLARYPTNYPPFAIVVGLPIIAATLVAVLRDARAPVRARLITVGAVGVTAVALLVGVVRDNWAAIQAASNTVYPGQRRSSGARMSASSWFSAPVLEPLKNSSQIVNSNASETSTAFTVAAVWAGVLMASSRTLWARMNVPVVLTAALMTAFWLAWCAWDWGTAGTSIPIANLVPPGRAIAMAGFPAAFVLCLVLSYWEPPRTVLVPVIAGIVVTWLTVWGGRDLAERYFPTLSSTTIWVSALVAGALVALVTFLPGRWWPVALMSLAMVAVAFRVNPLIFGVGDLRDSSTARAMLGHGEQARADGTYWASDFQPLDSLMQATATPALTGRQQTGPKKAEWRRLDPTGASEGVWNRGGAYVWMRWGAAGSAPRFENASPDTIIVTIDPCDLKRRMPKVSWIASTQVLGGRRCLRPAGTLVWFGTTNYLYRTA